MVNYITSQRERWYNLKKMNLFELLQRGYLPKVLPPSFNTYNFALKGEDLLASGCGLKYRRVHLILAYRLKSKDILL